MPQVHEAFVMDLVPRLKDRSKLAILDVAAASGEPALSLAAALPQASFISTDIAEEYLHLGKARAEHAGFADRISFEAADGENLSQFADASFDAVTCSLGLMFFPDESKGLKEFYRVLKPGGVLAVTVWGSSVPLFLMAGQVAIKIMPPAPDAPPPPINTAMRFGDGRGLCDSISHAGFDDVARKELDVTFKLPGGVTGRSWWDVLWKAPFPLKPAVAQAKAAGREDAEDVARKMLEGEFRAAGYIKEDNTVEMTGNVCHYITARKLS